MTMTSEAKRALAKTIRELRKRLIDDLGEATTQAYLLKAEIKKAQLDEAARVKRTRLEGWIDEQVRALPAKGRAGAAERLRDDVIKDAASTLLLRLVYLRLLEASGLSAVKVITGGWDSRGYKDFCEAAPELVRADETEGYAALLGLMFDELAHDLPGLYGPVRMTPLVPVPAATLRAVVDALDDEDLASVWTDDTTLGWIYQYWNDPEREALDAKLAASKKLENHEIASKTQMFTERYMVEWLLHNTLGQMWLAMCKQHGWAARVTRAEGGQPSVLDQLEARRVAWRAQREAGPEAGGVALDVQMPIERGLEDRWKYWVPQPMPDDSVAQAPATVRDLKLLDPACGSGHFLVIAFELLFHLYKEEAWLRGETVSPDAEGKGEWSHRRIVESILENNLHGIDIDPKAVRIAAAALMLKARQLTGDAEPRNLNLVAPALSLASLADDDPARRDLYAAVQVETGIPPELTARIVKGLAGADHLGTLLRVDTAIDTAIAEFGASLSAAVPTKADQGSLFQSFAPARRKRITAEHAKAAVLDRLESFLDHHTGGADLGLRLRGEQLAAGVRFVRMVREAQYDIVVGNPPYQGTSKMADKAYIEKEYPRGKVDLYAAFIERGLQLARIGGISAFVTMQNWMFINRFSALREWLISSARIDTLVDLRWCAFENMRHNTISMFVTSRVAAPTLPSVALCPSPRDERDEALPALGRKKAALLCQVGRHQFDSSRFAVIGGKPFVYWWSKEYLGEYERAPKLGEVAPVRVGMKTSNNDRFVRFAFEIAATDLQCLPHTSAASPNSPWVPYVQGADGRRWFEPVEDAVHWRHHGLQIRLCLDRAYGSGPQSETRYFKAGVACSTIGSQFSARLHRAKSVFSTKGTSVFFDSPSDIVCLLNSPQARAVVQDLNPGMGFEVGDIGRIQFRLVPAAGDIVSKLSVSFSQHEAAREPSVEFQRPGSSTWLAAQSWANRACDRDAPMPEYEVTADEAPASVHLSFAVGVALGRFGAAGEGILADVPASALPHGILFMSDASDDDSLAHPACAPLHATWATYGAAIDEKRTLKNYLQDKFFPDVHRKMYENRPIHFPLSSTKKAFVAYVSIHRWNAGTLNDLLAEHLYPAKKRLEGEVTDLRAARDGADRKASKAAEKRFGEVGKWLEELTEFIALVEQCAEKGPLPPDAKTAPRPADARYAPDLDDGVMINSAALWPLLEPQWKDPKKWWKELANAEGKKDYDWSHLAARYFPGRVDAKCKLDPSLAVAHGCFWKYHPAKAYQWELRLQDEIRPDFTLEEVGSDAARAAFEAERPETVEELVTKEHLRRARKKAKADGFSVADDDDAPEVQGSLGLESDDGDDVEVADA